MIPPRIITAILSLAPCEPAARRAALESAESIEAAIAATSTYDLEWLARSIPRPIAAARATYDEATAQARAARDEARARARATYDEAAAPAWAAYREATAPAWAAYREATAQALAAYRVALVEIVTVWASQIGGEG